MQNTIKTTSIALAIAFTFGFVGVMKADAATQSTYFVDVTGNGCGNNCADFYKYLATQGITVSNTNTTNTSNTTNGSTTRTTSTSGNVPVGQNGQVPSTSYVQYPYQVYTPFGSNSTTTGSNGSTNGNNSQMGTINYVQYPYYAYTYFQNPTPKYDSYLSGQYQDSAYIYYGKDATQQMNTYKKTYTSTGIGSTSGFTMTNPSLPSNYSYPSGSGFTLTSVR